MIGALLTATLATATALATNPLLKALPAPEGEPADLYRGVAGSGAALRSGLLAAVMCAVITARLPMPTWPAWLTLATIGVIAIVIDDATCYLPRRLTHVGTGLTVAGLVLAAAASWLPWANIGVALLCGLGVFALFWLLWRIGGTMGFGDVRLALWFGIAAGTGSFTSAIASLLMATVMPLLFVATRYRGRSPFPYGPGLLFGAIVGAALV